MTSRNVMHLKIHRNNLVAYRNVLHSTHFLRSLTFAHYAMECRITDYAFLLFEVDEQLFICRCFTIDNITRVTVPGRGLNR